MKTVFVIRNQNGHYLGRHGEWLDGSHVPALFRTEHRDVAVNELVEVNLRDFDLLGEVVGIDGVEGDYPVVEVTNPIVSTPAEEATDAAAGVTAGSEQQVSEA